MKAYGWETKSGWQDMKWERFGHSSTKVGRRVEKRRFKVAARQQALKGIDNESLWN